MIKSDTLHTGQETRDKLISGIRKTAISVGGTMGTGGSNSIIEAVESPGHLITNDGYTIVSNAMLADPIEEMGRKILLEAISRANKHSGDGSSTTCVLTAAILEEGQKYLGNTSPMDIKRSLEACVPFIEESIKKNAREITEREVGPVASISAEDEEIGNRVQEIYEQIGKEGIIHWDVSKTIEDSYVIGNGITVSGATYYSPYMCDANENGQNTNQVRLKNPTILITKQKITSAAEFNDLFLALNNKEIKDVVVFCDEIEPLVIPDLVKTRMMRGFRAILVKMPVLWKDWWYEDLALASGARIIDPAAGLPLRNATIADLGSFGNILITKEDTFIDGIQDVSGRIADLEQEGSDDSKIRASRLNTKTARYFVGAQSDSALSYRRLKVEDAISAAWQALHGGVVAGGGVALLDAIRDLPDSTGGKILWNALKAPAVKIIRNIGFEASTDGNALMINQELIGFGRGLNTRTGIVGDMFEAHITDPTNVVLNAVKNAVSVAATVLTINTLITLPRDEVPEFNLPPNAVLR